MNANIKELNLPKKAQRINEIDIISGLALVGLLLVNIGLFSFPSLHSSRFTLWTETWQHWSMKLIHFFAGGKFLAIFSFLFGLGFSIFMRNARLKTDQPMRLFAKRLLFLLAIGLLHSYFIWYGDTLVTYSLLGVVLAFFWHSTPNQLLQWSFFLLVSPIIIFLVGSLLLGASFFAGQNDGHHTGIITQLTNIYGQGSIKAIFEQNRIDLGTIRIVYLLISPQILAMFLLGAYAGATRIFENLLQNAETLREIQIGALIIGLPVAVASTLYLDQPADSFHYNMTQLFGTYIADPCIGIFYISSVLILLQKNRWQKILGPFSALGRMALTNYIMQSVICTIIMYSYGCRQYGQMSPSDGFILVIGISSFQLLFSNIWLRYFKQGPLEYAWRYLTYK
ncbi:MAG: DUF418 domain-containing protein [Sphingobacterium sp.]|jgi:uncharacterized protein|nr:DUF418 domain-containing protein [Sphingobacterium sp.]